MLVRLNEGYLVTAQVGVLETQEVTPGCEIYDLVNAEKGKSIFWACLVQARVVNAHPPFPILFLYNNWIRYSVWVLIRKPTTRSLANSALMALHFS
jgi:hypothetical protein